MLFIKQQPPAKGLTIEGKGTLGHSGPAILIDAESFLEQTTHTLIELQSFVSLHCSTSSVGFCWSISPLPIIKFGISGSVSVLLNHAMVVILVHHTPQGTLGATEAAGPVY